MAVLLDMEPVHRIIGLIHMLSVPVALLGLALWSPMGPNAELRVAIPVGHLIFRERLERRLKRSRRHAKTFRRRNGCRRWRDGPRGGRALRVGSRGCLTKDTG